MESLLTSLWNAHLHSIAFALPLFEGAYISCFIQTYLFNYDIYIYYLFYLFLLL